MLDISQRNRRIEQSLLPQLNRDEYAPEKTLTTRMQHYKTPGVSIAVINNGIEWTQRYGVCKQDSNIAITKTTLFQAASNGSDGGYYLAEEIIRAIAKEYDWIDF